MLCRTGIPALLAQQISELSALFCRELPVRRRTGAGLLRFRWNARGGCFQCLAQIGTTLRRRSRFSHCATLGRGLAPGCGASQPRYRQQKQNTHAHNSRPG